MKEYRGYWQIIFIIANEALFYVQKLFVNDKLLKNSKAYVISEYSIPRYFYRGNRYGE